MKKLFLNKGTNKMKVSTTKDSIRYEFQIGDEDKLRDLKTAVINFAKAAYKVDGKKIPEELENL